MTEITGTRSDFDFLFGSWRVHNRRLRERLVGSTDWQSFEGQATCQPFLDGIANVDQMDVPDLGFSGMSVRLFDATASQWSIYWAASTTGRLEPPVRGGFDGPIGTFLGDDDCNGQPVTVRFTWDASDPQHPRWEQAFTTDGIDWETNWTMDFSRP